MKNAYPTFIVDTGEDIHPFVVCVPDFDILTEGDTLPDAIEMARDAIGLAGIEMVDNGAEIPEPSSREKVGSKLGMYSDEIDFDRGILTYVDVDFDEYRRRVDTKVVRKNVSLPSWLNYEADKAGINVSRVLQDALMSVLGVTRGGRM